MFTLKSDHRVKWPVKVRMPVDGGRFTAVFLMPAQDRVDAIVAEARAASAAADTDRPILREFFVGFEDVQDETGHALTWSAETRDALLNIPYVRAGVAEAFYEAITGSRRKN